MQELEGYVKEEIIENKIAVKIQIFWWNTCIQKLVEQFGYATTLIWIIVFHQFALQYTKKGKEIQHLGARREKENRTSNENSLSGEAKANVAGSASKDEEEPHVGNGFSSCSVTT